MFKENLIKPANYQIEKKEFYKWYNQNLFKIKSKIEIQKKNFASLDFVQWNVDQRKSITSKDFYSIIAIDTKNSFSREVKRGWSQPMIKEKYNPAGLIVLFRKEINSIPYYLVNCKFEPGNIKLVHVSPTIQKTFSNIKFNKRIKDYYLKTYNKYRNERTILNTLVSEDGGRFYKKQSRNVIIDVTNKKIIKVDYSFKWVSFYLLKEINSKSKIINPHIRSIFSLI